MQWQSIDYKIGLPLKIFYIILLFYSNWDHVLQMSVMLYSKRLETID